MADQAKAKQGAFDAIHDEALNLSGLIGQKGNEAEMREGIERIISLTRYQIDLRSDAEKKKASRN